MNEERQTYTTRLIKKTCRNCGSVFEEKDSLPHCVDSVELSFCDSCEEQYKKDMLIKHGITTNVVHEFWNYKK